MQPHNQNISTLISLLAAHGVTHAVVCPGSRNAPIVQQLAECKQITCHAITDERSAGFFALGMAQRRKGHVAVCVTSGTALLNLLPAVAEAFYQDVPLVVISADRPAAWINQQDGQTLPQHDALGRFVKRAVSLPEPHNEVEHWHCNRLINEALLEMCHHGCKPVHINVPLAEPLFVDSISQQIAAPRIIRRIVPTSTDAALLRPLVKAFARARRPVVVVGQLPEGALNAEHIRAIRRRALVISEVLSHAGGVQDADGILRHFESEKEVCLQPDFILYLGGTLIGKLLKEWLRSASDAEQWRVSESGEVCDTFMRLTTVVEATPADVLTLIAQECNEKTQSCDEQSQDDNEQTRNPLIRQWLEAEARLKTKYEEEAQRFSEAAAVNCLSQQLAASPHPTLLHCANSLSVRLANRYARRYVWCNRGVNGIEGSLSAAAGMSAISTENVFCIIGDLSFFYDQNALWNENLRGNLRIMLLNNGGGKIFSQVRDMPSNSIIHRYIYAAHSTRAQGICLQNNIEYLCASNAEEMQNGISRLTTKRAERPMLLEIIIPPHI